MAKRYSEEEIGRLIAIEAEKTGADPYLLLATAFKESSLNNLAVGDNGTSYGLFQHHVGGAGGQTHASARQFLDPVKSISERAQAFAGAKTGADAAAIQRPENAVQYAKDVDRLLAQLKSSVTAVKGYDRAKWSPVIDEIDRQAAALGLVGSSNDRTPDENKDAGGAKNSNHLTTRPEVWARDYAGAMNAMKAFEAWARRNRSRLGLIEILGPTKPDEGHSDHVHVAGNSSSSASGMMIKTGFSEWPINALKGLLSAGKTAKDATGKAIDVAKDGIGGAVDTLVDALKTLLRTFLGSSIAGLLIVLGGALVVLGSARAIGAYGGGGGQ